MIFTNESKKTLKKSQKSLDKTSSIVYNILLLSAAMAQQVEHILGKDEVTGSNPVSSSNGKSLEIACLCDFKAFVINVLFVLNVGEIA